MTTIVLVRKNNEVVVAGDGQVSMGKKQYSLAAVTAPDQFKSYEDLKKRLDYVLGHKQPTRRVFDEEVADEDNSRGSYAPDFNSRKAEATVAAAVSSPASEDEDDALKYFQKLAEE